MLISYNTTSRGRQWRRPQSPPMEEVPHMQARDIMTHETITIRPEASVRDAARRLSDYNISGMPVVNQDHQMVGIITEADLISKEGVTVADLMTERVVSVTEYTPVDQIAQILTSNRFKRVPVLRGAR